jgi:glyoxylase-like metal-dependent hydrolase (beta-lactamase superfamily II)
LPQLRLAMRVSVHNSELIAPRSQTLKLKSLPIIFTFALALTACAVAPTTAPVTPQLWRQIAPQVFVQYGSRGAASAGNRARIGSVGVVFGPKGALVVNAGTSYAHAKEIATFVEENNPMPIKAVVLTQPWPEFIMGAEAFARQGVPVYAHPRAAELIIARCETCRRNLHSLLGAQAMQGTEVINIPPAQFVMKDQTFDAIGESVAFFPLGHAVTEGDLAVWLPQHRVLFAGALVQHARVPDLREADTQKFLDVLQRVKQLPTAQIVTGYSAPQAGGGFADVQNYVQWLRTQVKRAFEAGIELSEIKIPLEGTPYENWERWDHHRANVQRVYLEIEREGLKK